MWPSTVPTWLLLLLLQGGPEPARATYHMLLMPAEMPHPSDRSVCVQLSNVTEPTQVLVTLQSQSRETKVMDVHTEGPDLLECLPFKVPPPAGGENEVASVKLCLLSGGITRSCEAKQVLIKRTQETGILLTDKPIYLPGQTVILRIIIMNPDFYAMSNKCPLVLILDPNGYRIKQWENVTPRQGIVELNFTLSPDPVLGLYTVQVAHLQVTQTFEVAEMAFPKFDISILLPAIITLEDERFQMKICGRHTYGRPVSGIVHGKLCQPAEYYYWQETQPVTICSEFHGKTDKSGCLGIEVQTRDFPLSSYDYKPYLEASASLMEEGTGVTFSKTGRCELSPNIAYVIFEESDMDTYYKPRINYRGVVQLLRADRTPMKGEKVYLSIQRGGTVSEMSYTTNDEGRASFVLDTSTWEGATVDLKAQFKKEKPEYHYGQRNPFYPDAVKIIYCFHSLVKSFVKIQPPKETLPCEQEFAIEVDYIIRHRDIPRTDGYLKLHHFVMARGHIVQHGQTGLNITVDSVTKGTHYIPLAINADIAPSAKLLIVAFLTNGMVMADTAEFSVSKCFRTKAHMEFSVQEASPGDEVSLQLESAPDSLCAICAVDKSVTLARPEAELTPDIVYQKIAFSNTVGYPYRVQEPDPPCFRPRRFWKRSLGEQPDAGSHNIRKRAVPWAAQTQNQIDIYTIIQRMGIKVISNCLIKKPPVCSGRPSPPIASQTFIGPDGEVMLYPDPVSGSSTQIISIDMEGFDLASPDDKAAKSDVRTYFPDTWFCHLMQMNSSGQAMLNLTIPDSITMWDASMFCFSDMGFGLSPLKTIKSTKAFFIKLDVPYSVLRKETFSVMGTVFNYMENVLMVRATLTQSSKLKPRLCPDCVYTRCLEAGTGTTFTWMLEAMELGEVQMHATVQALDTGELCGEEKPVVPEKGGSDSVMQTILVKSEGMLVETSYNTLLCAEGNLVSEVISVEFPKHAVEGSEAAEFSVVGDTMGLALKNMDNLVVMPTGCGEQTMVHLAPLISLRRYLEETRQMTEFMQQKSDDIIQKGIQRQMSFRRTDGSFSTFQDDEGNTWLTTLALSTFCQLKDRGLVDATICEDLQTWLRSTQLPNGSFQPIGKPFKNTQMDGPSNEIALSAYITTHLMEDPTLHNGPMAKISLEFLKNVTMTVEGTHTMAMLANTYALSGDEDMLRYTLTKLYEKANISEKNIFWTLTPQTSKKASGWTLPEEGVVETSALVLLAHLRQPNVTKEDIRNASRIAAWIMRKQNPCGGFATTQDTMEALKALTAYGASTHRGRTGINLTLTSEGKLLHAFVVNSSNELLVQQVKLPSVAAKYEAAVEGDGCVSVQTILRYNVPPPKSRSFNLTVDFRAKECGNTSCTTYTMDIHISYTGSRVTTNMALIEVEMLSGFRPDEDSLIEVEKHPLVKKIEKNQDKVIIYMEALTHEQENIRFQMLRDVEVEGVQKRSVTAYDYYAPEDRATTSYS
ncbi:alpha-2-macroglobulin-like protein 1 isoform X2 [Ambystoma mexicanum]|uniref:alpha-2-macroglobulin-like protein 1 isoform X2 n=1 Tax=Ambystoma mexicanum TaxID=8296 RepID=UPI0037E7F277